MLTVISGPAGCGKSKLIREKIKALAENGQKSLLVVPENMSHIAERRLLLSCGNSISRYARVTTFTKLENDILSACSEQAPSLDGGGRVLTMYRALNQLKGKLCYFGESVQKSRLVSALLNTAQEFISCNVSSTELCAKSALLSPKMQDIALIYHTYLSLCESSKLDPSQKLDKASALIHRCGLFKDTSLFFDDFSHFSEQKYRFIEHLAEEKCDLCFSVMTNGDVGLFTEQDKLISRLNEISARKSMEFESHALPFSREGRAPELNALENLFALKPLPFDLDPTALSLYSASNENRECELAAALVRFLILKKGARLRDIAVVCGDENAYAPLLESAFMRYDIPCFFSRRQEVLKKPAFAAALGPLECIDDGMRLETVLSYLHGGMLELDRDRLCKLENYALMWGISGKAWLDTFTKPTSGFDRPFADEEARIREIEDTRAFVMAPVIKLKEALDNCTEGSQYAAAFKQHLQDSLFKDRLLKRIEQLTARGKNQEAMEYSQLYGILNSSLTQFESVCQNTEMNSGEFLRLLCLTLSQYDVSSIPDSLDSVTVCTYGRLSPAGIKHLIVLGARYGLLPPEAGSNGLISDSEKDALEDEDIFLPRDRDTALSAQSDIYRAFNAPDLSLTVVYPLSGRDGSEYSKSYVVEALQGLLPRLKEQSADEALKYLSLSSKRTAFELACSACSEKAFTSAPAPSPAAKAARSRLSQDLSYRRQFEFLRRYSNPAPEKIGSLDTLRKLYGKYVPVSASAVERFNTCRFSYFARFGLGAKERQVAQLGALEVGTMVHAIVENAVKALCRGEASDPESAARSFTDLYAATLKGADTPRMQAIIAQIKENAVFMVKDVWAEIESGDFKPAYFEMSFSRGGDKDPITWEHSGLDFMLKGKIDRVDKYKNYLKVIDYKTGSKEFLPSDLMEGRNLQPFIYMYMLQKAGAGENCAALFLPVKANYLEISSADDFGKEKEKRTDSLRRMGLVRQEPELLYALEHTEEGQHPRFMPVVLNKDGDVDYKRSNTATGEQMQRIINYTHTKLMQFSSAVASGDISVQPKTENACAWCPYKTACHFEEGFGKKPDPSPRAGTFQKLFEILDEEDGL